MSPLRAVPLCLATLLASATPAAAFDNSAWAAQAAPAPGPALVIGRYALGCIGGAQALPAEGPGYQVLRLPRHRYYGHPDLIRFVTGFGAQVARNNLGLALVGDMAQPRGGPMPAGHSSHQTGLDVDIWFRLTQTKLPPQERDSPKGVTMVRPGGEMSADWGPEQVRMLQIAASSPDVDRIFVNAAIKRAVCSAYPGDKPAWVAKLRPWWGHDEHFHVRLHCPADSPDCEPTKAIPPGDGCEEVESWLAAESRLAGKAVAKTPRKVEKPALPAKCEVVLNP
jgi:penicillin-insensitive murein endopeptidase